jgi:hypothetical protein
VTDARSWRTGVTERTAGYAAALARLPRFVPLVAVAALVVGGMFAGGVAGAALLTVVAAFAGWLAVLGWEHLSPGGRLARVLIVVALLAVAARKVLTG